MPQFFFFGIFITFSLWHWNIITNKRKKMYRFFLLFFFKISFKKKSEKKLFCSQVQWHPRVHNFSPLITPFFLWMFMANISSKELALAHHSLSPKQQSVCTHVAKPGLSYQFSWQECCQVSFFLFWADELISGVWELYFTSVCDVTVSLEALYL